MFTKKFYELAPRLFELRGRCQAPMVRSSLDINSSALVLFRELFSSSLQKNWKVNPSALLHTIRGYM